MAVPAPRPAVEQSHAAAIENLFIVLSFSRMPTRANHGAGTIAIRSPRYEPIHHVLPTSAATVPAPNAGVSSRFSASRTLSVFGSIFDGDPAALALPDREQRLSSSRPVNVVDPEAERDLVAAGFLVAARQADERLAAPRGHVERLAVFGQLDAVRAGGFAAGHLLPLPLACAIPRARRSSRRCHHLRASRPRCRRAATSWS